MYSTVQDSKVKIQKERPKSTMLSPEKRSELEGTKKPWSGLKDPSMRIAYYITYGVMLVGVAASAARCYLGWQDVPIMKGNLCSVMDEHFDSEEGLFGDNGKFFREVDMSGFG